MSTSDRHFRPAPSASLFDLTGKTALITGASRGIGRTLVLALADAGANVVVASRDQGRCEPVAEAARARGVEALAVGCHVGRWEECERLVSRAYAALGPLDVLVNNAGMAVTSTSMRGISEELFDKTIAVNLKGPMRLSCLVGERMAQDGGGSIINISSTAAFHPNPACAAYGAAKAALNSLTAALAVEYGPHVRVNAIALGPTRSSATEAWFDGDAFRAAAAGGTALRRGGEPEEAVGPVLFLASSASSYTTGTVLQVDGGVYAPVLMGTGGHGGVKCHPVPPDAGNDGVASRST